MKQKPSVKELIARYTAGDRNFSDLDLSDLNFVGWKLRNTSFENTNFSGSTFRKCDFTNSSFTNAVLTRANIEHTFFKKCSMINLEAIATNISFCSFNKSNLQYSKFMGSWITESDFDKADLSYADLSFAYDVDGVFYTDAKCIKTLMPDLRIRHDLSIQDEFQIEIEDELDIYEIQFTDREIGEIVQQCEHIYDMFIQDKNMCEHLLKTNPFSLENILSKLMDLNQSGHVKISGRDLENLHQLSEEVKFNEWTS
jgi:hypothetical protein